MDRAWTTTPKANTKWAGTLLIPFDVSRYLDLDFRIIPHVNNKNLTRDSLFHRCDQVFYLLRNNWWEYRFLTNKLSRAFANEVRANLINIIFLHIKTWNLPTENIWDFYPQANSRLSGKFLSMPNQSRFWIFAEKSFLLSELLVLTKYQKNKG